MTHIILLPVEMLVIIFSFLNANELLICSKINKLWNAVTNDDILWKSRYIKLAEIMYYSDDDINQFRTRMVNQTCMYKKLYMSFTRHLVHQTKTLFPVEWDMENMDHLFSKALKIIKGGFEKSFKNNNIKGIRRGNPKIKYADAIANGYVEMIAYYISLGIDPILLDLVRSINKGNIEVVKLLLRYHQYQIDNNQEPVFDFNKSSSRSIRNAVSESLAPTAEMFQLVEPYGGKYTINDLQNQFAAGNLNGIKYIMSQGIRPTTKSLTNAIKLSYDTNYMRANSYFDHESILLKLTPQLFEFGILHCKPNTKNKIKFVDTILACRKLNYQCLWDFLMICHNYGYNIYMNHVVTFMKQNECLNEENIHKLNIVFDFMIRELKVSPVTIRSYIIHSFSIIEDITRRIPIPVQDYLNIFQILQ